MLKLEPKNMSEQTIPASNSLMVSLVSATYCYLKFIWLLLFLFAIESKSKTKWNVPLGMKSQVDISLTSVVFLFENCCESRLVSYT